MALFLTIAIGYLVGEINIKGFSLGVGAVLFVALAMGWFAPKSVPAPMVGTLGLALFLYAVGVQYGKQFFLGLTSAAGRRANVMALIGVLLAGVVSLLLVKAMGLNLGYALGLFAGSGTSTPTLQAAIATLGNDDPAVGYSVSYPFGVAGPILLLYIAFMILKPKIETPRGRRPGDARNRAAQPGSLRQDARRGDERAAGRSADRGAAHGRTTTSRPRPASSSPRTTSCSSSAPSKEALAQASRALGEAAPGRLVKDRSDLDYLRVFASRPTVVGRAIGDLDLPGDKAAIIAQVRRGDTDIMPRPDLVLEFGDRVGLLANRGDFAGAAQVLRRLDQGHRRVQLHLHRSRHGARLPDRRDPDSAPRHRQARDRAVGRADRGAGPRQPAAHRRHELDDPAVGQPRAAQPRADAVPRAGRHVVGAEVRRDGGGDRVC